jgi:riboflavin synthase
VESNLDVPGFEDVPVDGPDRGENEEGGEEEEAVSTITLSWPGHEADKDGVFPAVDIVAGMSVELTVGAEAGIAGFVIRLESDTPAFMSLCSKMTSTVLTADQAAEQGYVMIDLIGDPEAVTKMAGVGLSTGDQLKNKTSVPFSLSTLVPMIPSAGQAGPDTDHTFILTVTDNNGDENSWSLTFHVPAE